MVTVYVSEGFGDRNSIECEHATLLGEVVHASTGDDEVVVPLANVRGIEGEDVEQRVDEVASPGGRFTELVTNIS